MLPRIFTHDRRRRERGTPGAEPPRAQLVAMIRGTFREMPGLSLHLNQAARLFGLRDVTCQIVLDDLVAAGALRRSEDGQYISADRESTRLAHRDILSRPP
jgi:hypothetical protein